MTFFYLYTVLHRHTHRAERCIEALCEVYNDLDRWLWVIQAIDTPAENMLYLAE